jgi:hypothetical protein
MQSNSNKNIKNYFLTDLLYFRVLIYIVLLYWLRKITEAAPFVTESNIPEYHEYMRLQNLNKSTTETTPLTTESQEMIQAPHPFQNLLSNFPFPCKEIDTRNGATITNIYCIAIMFFWILLVVSVIAYHIRSMLSIKRSIKKQLEKAGFYSESGDQNGQPDNRADTEVELGNGKKVHWMLPGGQDTPDGSPV